MATETEPTRAPRWPNATAPRPELTHTGGVLAPVLAGCDPEAAAEMIEAVADRQSCHVDVMACASAEGAVAAGAVERAVRERRPRLIVAALGRRDSAERADAAALVLRLVRTVNVPVLAAAPSLEALPRETLVTIGPGRSAAWAAHLTLELMDSPGRLTLVHVDRRGRTVRRTPAGWDLTHGRAAVQRFRRIESGLPVPRQIGIARALAEGEPDEALCELAERRGADLIGTTVAGRSTFERIVLGRALGPLLHTTPCSVLLTPAWSPDLDGGGR